MLSDVIAKADISYSRCTRVKLVWIVQSVGEYLERETRVKGIGLSPTDRQSNPSGR